MSESAKISALFKNESLSIRDRVKNILWMTAKETESCMGAFYLNCINDEGEVVFRFIEGYAFFTDKTHFPEYGYGEGLIGQVAKDGFPIIINNVPNGYLKVVSGLGQASPSHLLIYPFVNNAGKTLALIELAAFKQYDEKILDFLKNISSEITEALSKIQ